MSCALATEKVTGFIYDTSTSAWTMCDVSCKDCLKAGPGFCTGCKDPVATTIVDTDLTTLAKAWTNGTLPATGGMCHLVCPDGYNVDDATTRANCVTVSNGVILSIISIISIVLLI